MTIPSAKDERLWTRLDRYLKAGKLVPVIGPGCITFGEDDRPLYPWLAQKLVERLGIELPQGVQPPYDLHTVAATHLKRGTIEDLCTELDVLLDANAPDVLQPGPLLRDLARIAPFTHYFTLGFDPLLERAIEKMRYGGLKKPRVWEFSLGQPAEDLPFGPKDAPETLVGYLFGRVSPNPSFHLWDHDAIEFVWSLQRVLPTLNTLASTLASSNLLLLGTDFSDWLVRFFLRVIKSKPLNEDNRQPFMLAERHVGADSDAVLFYDALRGGIEIVNAHPQEFAREFTTRALKGFAIPAQTGAAAAPLLPPVDRQIPLGAVFVSYCHADRDFAVRVTEKLQRFGCLVWLDRERLEAGDQFENRLEDAVTKYCAIFLSLITKTTESRVESYFHKERHWAAERSLHFAPGEPFYIPLAAEDVPVPPSREPREFSGVHVEIAIGGDIPDGLCERIKAIQERRLALNRS